MTAHPTSEWIVQQLRAAFPGSLPYRYVIMDRDSKFGGRVMKFLKATGLAPIRTSFRSPWQNGVAKRWVSSCRRELLDHVIVFNKKHLRRLIRNYLGYYHEDRTHIGLEKEMPEGRPVQRKPSPYARIDSLTRVGGLHHRYVWRDAA